MPKTIHALLVGINAYQQKPLYGCVNDALAVGRFFKTFTAQPETDLIWNPKYLLAPHAADQAEIDAAAAIDPKVADQRLPTRQELIEAFETHFLSDQVKPDDICLFYYSGHGAQEVAAPEFQHLESDGMNQTFVCLDSREPGNRDLLDKEMAWLLAQTRSRIPNGHLLVITDNCFAGNATRNSDATVRDRRERASDEPTPFSELLGVKNNPETDWIFKITDGKAFYTKEAPHIHLAASRENETSKETAIAGKNHGVFTWNLLSVLQQGGTALNYVEIMRRTESMVRAMIANQLPQLNAWAGAAKSDSFLGADLAPIPTEYPVLYEKGRWLLQAGALNGISVDASGKRKTTVKLSGGREVEILELHSTYSLLNAASFQKEDTLLSMLPERAVILQMPAAQISVFIDRENVSEDAYAKLQQAVTAIKPLYCHFDAPNASEAEYAVMQDSKGHYMLVQKNSDYPVFKRQIQAFQFIEFCEAVGCWRYVHRQNKSDMSGLTTDDIELTFEVLHDVNPETVNGTSGKIVSEDRIHLTYQPEDANGIEKVPAIRCKVRLKKQGFWIGGLYMDNEFGIYEFLPPKQDTTGQERYFEYQADGASFNAVPIRMDPIRISQGVLETTEYIKIFISNRQFSLSDFVQEPLPLDEQTKRGNIGFGKGAQTPPEWMVITVPVRISVSQTQVNLRSLSGAGFRISGLPEGFEAKAAMSNLSAIEQKMRDAPAERSQEMVFQKTIMPPAWLWGDIPSASVVFDSRVDAREMDAVSVIELTDVKGQLNQPFFLELDEPCAEDEVIVAYGYDEDMEGFMPVGLSNGSAQVEILTLPSETAGQITDDVPGFQQKDLKRSVKMFFKKVIKKQNPNTLAMVNKDLSRETDPTRIKAAVDQAQNILLVTHGFLGDTDKMAVAIMQKTQIHTSYQVVLAYDFENLNTPLEKTAKDLYQRLTAVGVYTPDSGRRLTILASSMGGVMCRWMLEKDKSGIEYVRKLFLVAAPNLGTELSEFRKRLFSLIGKAMAGVQAFKPYLIPLSFLAKKAGKEVWVTLNQLHREKSDFLKALNLQAVLPAEIERSTIVGSVKDMSLNRNNNGKFWARLKRFALKVFTSTFIFEGEHDLVNPLDSQKGAPWFKPEDITQVKVDHMSYYFEEESLRVIEAALEVKPRA